MRKNHNALLHYMLVIFVINGLLGCDKTEKSKVNNGDSLTHAVNYYDDVGEWKVPKPLLSDLKNQTTRPAVFQLDGDLAILYSTKTNIIFNYRNVKTELDKTGGTTKLWLFSSENSKKDIYAFWWKKTREGKKLFFRGSSDQGKTFSKTQIVNSAGGILPSIAFSSDGKGHLTVAYYDERQPPYRIYANISSDNGLTWLSKDLRMDSDENNPTQKMGEKEIPVAYAIHPKLIKAKGNKLVLIWQQKKLINDKYRLQFVSRTSSTNGKTWNKEQVIYSSASSITVEFNTISNGIDIVVVGAFPKKGLLGFYAKNNNASEGLNWKELGAVSGTEDVNVISWLKPAISTDQYKIAYIVQKDTGKKYQIEVANLDLKNGKWSNVFRLDRNKHQPVETKALYLDLKALPNGEFVAVWEDYQTIIPVLMIDYTGNQGASWQKSPIKLTRGGLAQIKYPNLYVNDKKVTVLFEWYISRGERLPALSYIKIPYDVNSGLKVVPAPDAEKLSEKERKKLLTKRVKEFMDLRVKGEWDKTWDFMDPVYRQVTVKESWMRNMGFISYEKYRLTDLDVQGNFATATIDMTVSLRQQLRKGKVMEPTPPKSSSAKTKWLWFYDNWYFYPDSEFIRHLNF